MSLFGTKRRPNKIEFYRLYPSNEQVPVLSFSRTQSSSLMKPIRIYFPKKSLATPSMIISCIESSKDEIHESLVNYSN
jgi:hypothetical protein